LRREASPEKTWRQRFDPASGHHLESVSCRHKTKKPECASRAANFITGHAVFAAPVY
jgi:hypothetical protein